VCVSRRGGGGGESGVWCTAVLVAGSEVQGGEEERQDMECAQHSTRRQQHTPLPRHSHRNWPPRPRPQLPGARLTARTRE
jgi:hypothetical protein